MSTQFDRTTLPPEEDTQFALTPQQRRLTDASRSRLNTYRELIVGDAGWVTFFGFELATLLVSGMPSFVGLVGRSALYRPFLKSVGKGVVIGRGVTVRQPGRIALGRGAVIDDYAALDVRSVAGGRTDIGIDIGERVIVGRGSIVTTKGARVILRNGCNIGTNCRIACRSDLEIGESTLIAAYSYIGCGNHGHADLEIPIMEQPLEIKGPVKIGRNCWVGTRSTVVNGVTIGDDAIIGAHSLVLNDIPPRAIAAGTPAKIIRYRE